MTAPAMSRAQGLSEIEADWMLWLATLFPAHVTARFAAHHVRFWDWAWAIQLGEPAPPHVAIWARGGAKSSSAELAVVATAARRRRRYGLYVSGTQDQADKHVDDGVAALLESDVFADFYPEVAARQVGKYGNSRGWRRNRLHTASGFVIDAIGLDTAARGFKVEDQRPDLIVIDDIDGEHDTQRETQRKVDTLTKAILPTGSPDATVLAIQNLIHPQGVFARLAGIADVPADFLQRRELNGPVPALVGMEVALDDDGFYTLVAGEPTWAGQGLAECQVMIDTYGLRAFRTECQHEVDSPEGALIAQDWINTDRRVDSQIPGGGWRSLRRRLVMVDPSFSGKPGADECGIVVGGMGRDGHAYILADLSGQMTPHDWGRRAIDAYRNWECSAIGYESNLVPEIVTDTLTAAATEAGMNVTPRLVNVRANKGESKLVRLEHVSPLYQQHRVHHVGVFTKLERQLTTWTPDDDYSPDRLDACVHLLGDEQMLHAVALRSPARAHLPKGRIPSPAGMGRIRTASTVGTGVFG